MSHNTVTRRVVDNEFNTNEDVRTIISDSETTTDNVTRLGTITVLIFWTSLVLGFLGYLFVQKFVLNNDQIIFQSDYLVIGGGLAGLQASIHLSKIPSLKVHLIDKNSSIGGNSAKASSGINAAETPWQIETHEITSDFEQFKGDIHKSGKGTADEGLVDLLVYGSQIVLQESK